MWRVMEERDGKYVEGEEGMVLVGWDDSEFM